MVRRRKISETGVQLHQAETHDNEVPASTAVDRCGSDQNSDIMSIPVSKEQAAFELGHSVKKGHELVVEGLELVLKRKSDLTRRLRERSVSKAEFDMEMAEIESLHRQIKAFSQQLEASEKNVGKILKKDKNNGQ